MSLDPTKLALLLASLSNFSTTIKSRLDGKLNAIDTAVNSAKLEGKTLAEIQTLIGGDISAALAVLEADFAAFIARRDNPHEVTAAQVGLGNVANYSVATLEEAIAGLASDKYMTPANSKALLDAFWAEQAGTAPETLDTINEIAAALQNNPDVITALQTLVNDNAAAITALDARVDALDAHAGKTYVEVGGNVDSNTITVGEGETAAQVTLANVIAGLKSDIATGDAALQAEVVARTAADADLQAAVDGETAARLLAEAALDTKFTGLTDGLAANKVDKGGNVGTNTITQVQESIDPDTQQPVQTNVEVTLDTLVAQLQAGIAAAGDATALEALQTSFNAFVAAKATSAEVIEGIDDAKYVTSLGAKAAIDAAVNALVGAAPETLDTINELAAALQNNPDAITALQTLVAENADALEALTLVVDTKLASADKATSADVEAGTDDVKYVTSAALKPTLDAQDAAIAANTSSIEDLMAQMAAAFDSASADLTPEQPV